MRFLYAAVLLCVDRTFLVVTLLLFSLLQLIRVVASISCRPQQIKLTKFFIKKHFCKMGFVYSLLALRCAALCCAVLRCVVLCCVVSCEKKHPEE
jgi:hypothetical protein